MFSVSSCGVSSNLTQNANLQQTNVVLSQKNFHVVGQVNTSVNATYWSAIGSTVGASFSYVLEKISSKK